jgi:hypothetical protein
MQRADGDHPENLRSAVHALSEVRRRHEEAFLGAGDPVQGKRLVQDSYASKPASSETKSETKSEAKTETKSETKSDTTTTKSD